MLIGLLQQCCQPAARVSCSPADASPPGSRILCDSQSQVERTQSELLMAFATMTCGLDSVKSRIPVSFSLHVIHKAHLGHPPQTKMSKGVKWVFFFFLPAVPPQQDHTNSFLSCLSLQNNILEKSAKNIKTLNTLASIPLVFLVLTSHFDSQHLQMRTMRDNHVSNIQARDTTRVMSFTHGAGPPLWEGACYYEHASQERQNTSNLERLSQ